ncbi:MAG TPA: tRNA uridine-5-carboxymethylaminomethyl(34) synthesis GTPase MnmE [Caulobacteraceae bacterium]
MSDTIFALATAPGRAAVAVLRLSGPETRLAVSAICGPLPRPRRASLRTYKDCEGAVIDRGLVLWFPGPSSYTGEDSAELHLHGGPAVVDSVTALLLNASLRLAGPGEFTRRAFENGKLDLDQAEAVADLIEAETAAQARQAAQQLRGALGRRYRSWRRALTRILADLEAAVDFPDEEVPAETEARAHAPIVDLLHELDLALADEGRGRRIRDGYRIAVIGAPNAGKSTLFNSLLGRDAAIVAPAPGSTRDIIEAPLTLGGYRVLIADMAGIRLAAEPVEIEGVRRARAWAEQADLRLWVVDGSSARGEWRLAADLVGPGDLLVLNKSDLPPGGDGSEAEEAARAMSLPVRRLCLLDQDCGLSSELTARVTADLAGSDFPAATRARHTALLTAARADLARALAALATPELAAEDVRRAARALSRITGHIGSEDVLDQVFSSFCIGK